MRLSKPCVRVSCRSSRRIGLVGAAAAAFGVLPAGAASAADREVGSSPFLALPQQVGLAGPGDRVVFNPALAGFTITPAFELEPRADGVVIDGEDRGVAVTFGANTLSVRPTGPLGFTIRNVRFVGSPSFDGAISNSGRLRLELIEDEFHEVFVPGFNAFTATDSPMASTTVVTPEGTTARLSQSTTKNSTLRLEGAGTVLEPISYSSATPLDIDVVGGRYVVNGRASSTVRVFDGGELNGVGSVTALASSGRVAPGNGSISRFTVEGDATLEAGGTLEVEFGNGVIDQFRADGAATLGGAVEFVEIGPGTQTGRAYEFLSAGESVTGAFEEVRTVFLSGSELVGAELTYLPRSVAVTFNDFVPAFAAAGRTGSGRGAGAALDRAAGVDAAGSVQAVNAVLESGDQGSTLESLANNLAGTATIDAQAALARVGDVAAGRVRGEQVAVGGLDTRLAVGADGVGDTEAVAALLEDADFPERLTPVLWAEGVGGYAEVDGDASAAGSTDTTWGVALGGEVRSGDRASTVGVFFGFTDTQSQLDGLNDEAEVENLQLGMYGAHRFDENWHVNALAFGSAIGFDTSRATAAGTATGEADGYAVGGSGEALYDVALGEAAVLSPFVGVDGSFVQRDGYQESGAGALNLNVTDGEGEFLSSVVGVQIAGETQGRAGLRLRSSARVGWAHQLLDTTAKTGSSFSAAPSVGFVAESADRGRNSVRVGLGLELLPAASSDWTVYARYAGDFNRSVEEHAVRAGLAVSF